MSALGATQPVLGGAVATGVGLNKCDSERHAGSSRWEDQGSYGDRYSYQGRGQSSYDDQRQSCATGVYVDALGIGQDVTRCDSSSQSSSDSNSYHETYDNQSYSSDGWFASNGTSSSCFTGLARDASVNGTGTPLDGTTLGTKAGYEHDASASCYASRWQEETCTSANDAFLIGEATVFVPGEGTFGTSQTFHFLHPETLP